MPLPRFPECTTNSEVIAYNYYPDHLQQIRLLLNLSTHWALLLPFYTFFFREKRLGNDFLFEACYLLVSVFYSILYHGFAGTCDPRANAFARIDRVLATGNFVHIPGLVLYFRDTPRRIRLTTSLLAVYFTLSAFWVAYPALLIVPVLLARLPRAWRPSFTWPVLRMVALLLSGVICLLLSSGPMGFLFHSAWHVLISILISDFLLYCKDQ